VLAEAFRVLRPGGRLGISDVTADDGTDPGQLAEDEYWVGCGGMLTQQQYRDLLLAAGFTGITITSTHQAGPGRACIPPSSRQPSQASSTHNDPVSRQDRAQAARGESDADRAGGPLIFTILSAWCGGVRWRRWSP
jgi:hypothetical protein